MSAEDSISSRKASDHFLTWLNFFVTFFFFPCWQGLATHFTHAPQALLLNFTPPNFCFCILFICLTCLCAQVYMFTHACGDQRLSVFFNHFQPYFLRQGAPLNLEIASSARNGCKKASGVLLPRPSTGLQESVSDVRVRDRTWIRMLA